MVGGELTELVWISCRICSPETPLPLSVADEVTETLIGGW
jgi:hypothetical protein